MSKGDYICIVCPQSCHLHVEQKQDGQIEVSNHGCIRGKEYGENEHVNPKRMLTSTVTIKDANFNRIPVISKNEIPKDKLVECLKELYKVTVRAPIIEGEIIRKNICDTGVDIIASINMEKVI